MTKKKNITGSQTKEEKISPNAKNNILHSHSKNFSSEGIIKKRFLESGDLTTIQVTDTIIYPSGDDKMGAVPFRSLMEHLLENRPDKSAPVLIWLATDFRQLRHVIKFIEAKDDSLFEQLVASAICAEAKTTAPLYKALTQASRKATGKQFQTLTAHPDATSEVMDYIVYGHCRPGDEKNAWKDGPHYERLSKISELMTSTIDSLHLAHEWITRSIENAQIMTAIKNLEDSEISARPISYLTA